MTCSSALNHRIISITFVLMPRYLVIRFSSIGDIILTSPVVRCLKNQVKDSVVHFLTKKSYASLVQNNPHIDKVILFDNNLKEVLNDLKNENYDFIIDLHNNIRSRMVIARLKVKSDSFNKLNFQKWLYVNFKINRLPNIHIVDRYMQTIHSLGVVNDHRGLDFFIDDKDVYNDKAFDEFIKNGFVTMAIGAKHKTKQMPIGMIIELINKLQLPVVILGGDEDFDNGEQIIEQNSNALNMCGKITIGQSAYLVDRSKFIITHDTGMMHIAAAFKKPVISIWGNTVPQFGMYPYMPGKENLSDIFEVPNLSCRPCSKIGYNKCPKGHFNCMQKQDIEAISSKAKMLWDKV
jgi:ADP-heptose:LPS heptosyltransferase